MSECVTEKQFNEMLFTYEDYNFLKKRITELKESLDEWKADCKSMEATIERVQGLPEKWVESHAFFERTGLINKSAKDCADEVEAILHAESVDEGEDSDG